MRSIEFSAHADAALTLGVVARMFVLFLRESYSTKVGAISGVAVFMATGVLPYQQAFTILVNPAP